LNAAQKAEVAEHLRSKVYTTHGTRSEDTTSTKVEAEQGVKWSKDNSFYTHEVCEIDGKKFVIVGKIDRIEELPDGSRVLVEIKNRTNRLVRPRG
jgi:RecB family exonuclease